ncbi:MAG: hypothetical protein LQ344_001569 [Seirophora lacunosa]|nr:MAG: hypothetical protein LQ344_001569 [Seirophora lacunosa]
MSTITRTLRNLRRIGLKEYCHQMMNIGDTKAGTYIATDRYGNKYYENQDEELPHKPPTEDAVLRTGQRSWELPEHRENLTASRAAFKTYST